MGQFKPCSCRHGFEMHRNVGTEKEYCLGFRNQCKCDGFDGLEIVSGSQETVTKVSRLVDTERVATVRFAYLKATDQEIADILKDQQEQIERLEISNSALRSILAERESIQAGNLRKTRELIDKAYIPENREEKEQTASATYQAFLTKFNGDEKKARKAAVKVANVGISLEDI